MQSGISVSPELHNAFDAFIATPSHFCLPVTISSESLVPLDPIAFPPPTTDDDIKFFNSLPLLAPHIQPKTPIFLILRRTIVSNALIAVTYIPSTSPVRAKTLFASTRATLVRELGSEKFDSTIFAADAEEVLDATVWKERDADRNAATGGAAEDGEAESRRDGLMGKEERELNEVRRQEEQARSMARRRDVGIGGTIGRGNGEGESELHIGIGDGVKEALQRERANGSVIRLTIDVATETLTLISTELDVEPGSLASLISDSKAQYTFYHYPDPKAVIFIYTCPSSSVIKERLLHASSRNDVVKLAGLQGLEVAHKIEASEPTDITPGSLAELVNPRKDEARKAFARPKRPGR
ncbi:pinin/SDK/memA domain-containing protein [Histoplasma capsulatum]|uniref:Pinin/SDK/memA domain-containing protein n=1 Tax=Ajellomyces capsulatus TaxID=5037 RepID=A0A8A1M1M1_AJECA|nr:pinin/SDK/memA domain-containing protein [Histoplasma capsulatum]